MPSDNPTTPGQPGFGWSMRWPPTINGEFFQFAPDKLWQPINPGWSFGNLIVNHNNSSAPSVEQAVLSRHSYGRQIGRLLDVVDVLLTQSGLQRPQQPATPAEEAVKAFSDLLSEVEAEKKKAKQQRLDNLQSELETLIKEKPEVARQLFEAAQAALKAQAAKAGTEAAAQGQSV